MKIQQFRDFKPVGDVIEVTDTEVLSGVIPEYLNRTVEDAIRQGRLRSYLRRTCGGHGNRLSLKSGDGLVIISDSEELD